MKMMNIGILLVLSCLFFACAKGNNIPDGDAKLLTYKEAEELRDLNDLRASEKSLMEMGLKFEVNSAENSLEYGWGEAVQVSMSNSSGLEFNQAKLEALEKYIQNARKVLSKYSEPYNSESPSRRREVHSLSSETKAELEKKLELCVQTAYQLR